MSVWQYLLSRWSLHWVISLHSVTMSLCLRPSSLCCLHAVIQKPPPVCIAAPVYHLVPDVFFQLHLPTMQPSGKYVDALLPSAGSDYEGMHYRGRSVTPGMRLDQSVQLFTQVWNASTPCWDSCLLMDVRDIIGVARLWQWHFFKLPTEEQYLSCFL